MQAAGGGVVVPAASCRMTIVSPATTTDPSRTSPVLVPTPIVTVPLPLPLVPCVIASHDTLLDAVHVHADELAVTLIRIDPPAAGTPVCDAAAVKWHGAASWETSIDASLTDSEPRRATGSALGATRNDTVPSPCPVASEVIEIHDALEFADHVQSLVVATATLPFAPAYGAECMAVVAVT